MPPAARVTDQTSHGTPLSPGPGSPNVFIGGLPVWRAVPAAVAPGLQAAFQSTQTAIQSLETATKTAPDATSKAAAMAAETSAKTAAASAMMSSLSAFDMHICPIPSAPAPIPHGPGVVLEASKTVLVNFMPPARQGDKVVEALGGPDPIAMGCPTVIIG